MAYFQLALAMSIVGSAVVAGKIMTIHLPIMLSSCLRFAIACPILILWLSYQEKSFKIPARLDMLTLFLQALTGVFLFSIFLLFGLQHIGAIEAGLITGTLPAVTALLAVIMLREKLSIRQVLGILCTVIGATLLNTALDKGHAESSSTLGAVLIFAAVICEALFVVLGKRIGGRVSPLMISTVTCLFGLILFFPFAVREAYYFDFSTVTLLDWSIVVYFGLVVSALGFWLFYAGLSKVPASVAGCFMVFLPVSAVLLSSLILSEPIRILHLIAGACVMVGIILAAK